MFQSRNYHETVIFRAQSDHAFAQALLDEAATLFISGEADSAKLILRDLAIAKLVVKPIHLSTVTQKLSEL